MEHIQCAFLMSVTLPCSTPRHQLMAILSTWRSRSAGAKPRMGQAAKVTGPRLIHTSTTCRLLLTEYLTKYPFLKEMKVYFLSSHSKRSCPRLCCRTIKLSTKSSISVRMYLKPTILHSASKTRQHLVAPSTILACSASTSIQG